jgi:hypothetical protein
MKVMVAFVCEVAVQVPSRKINAIGILNELYSEEYPFVREHLSVVTGFEASATEVGQRKNIRVALHGPEDVELAAVEDSHTIKPPMYIGRPKYMYTVWDFWGVEFPSAGDYVFHILINGDKKAMIPLYVYARSR